MTRFYFFFIVNLFCFVLLCFAAESNLQECFCDTISFLNFIICFAVAESNFARLFCDRSRVLLHHLLRCCCCIRLQGCLAIGVDFSFMVCFAPTSAFFIVCVAAASDCKVVDLLYESFSSSIFFLLCCCIQCMQGCFAIGVDFFFIIVFCCCMELQGCFVTGFHLFFTICC